MAKKLLVRSAFVAGLILTPVVADAQAADLQHHPVTKVSPIETPGSLAHEHHELHQILARASKERGELGRAATTLEKVLAPHFRREEQIATPPLGLLSELSRAAATPEMRAVLPITDALERELPQMLKEHEGIRQAVSNLRAAAKKAGREEYVRFSDELSAHARQEEEILYPAAVLVGRYIKQTAPQK